MSSLLIRESQCSAGLLSCPASLPDNFCCSQGTSCIPLAGNTTALCCPTGQTCEKIQPITCDVVQQDPTINESSPIKTTILFVPLAKCGANLCCPFGYSCVGGSQCQKNSDQTKRPDTTTSSSSSAAPTSASPTSASPTSALPTSAASASSSPTSEEPSSTSDVPLVIAPVTTPTSLPTEESTVPSLTSSPDTTPTADASFKTAGPSPSKPSSPKTVSIIGGVVGGCAVLIVLGVIAFLFIRRRHSRHGDSEKTGFRKIKHLGPGSQGTSIIVSDPILQPNSYRADFIRKSPSISSSISQRPPQIVLNHTNASQRLSIPNPFDSPNPEDHSPTHSQSSISSEDDRNARTGVVGSGSRLAPIRAMKASSTRVFPQNVSRQPSGENINVFADPVMMDHDYDRRQTHATTFTDLMIEADLGDVRRGQPYLVPQPMTRI